MSRSLIFSSPRSRNAAEHHGHHDHRGGAVLLEAVERLLGVEPPAHHERRAEADADHRLREPERVEHRHAQLGHLARAERHLAQEAADQRERPRLGARGALGRAGGAAGQDRDLGPLAGLRRAARVAAVDQRVERVVAGLIGPGPEPASRAGRRCPSACRSTRRRRRAGRSPPAARPPGSAVRRTRC